MSPCFIRSLCCQLGACLLSSSVFAQIRVASFSTVLTEVAQRDGQAHVAVAGLIRPDQDPHEYQPTPSDLRQASGAQLILLSGKHLERYLDKIQQAAGGSGQLLAVGDLLPSLKINSETPGAPDDPHWWNSIANEKKAIDFVRNVLIKLDPANQADYTKNAAQFSGELDELSRYVKRKVAEIPRDRRKLVTSHDAFQYFAKELGFQIYSIEGISTDAEPSNRHVADLIDEIKREQVKAIFLENTLNPKVSREITKETGAKIGGLLYADGLGDGPGSTYSGMFRHNVDTIVNALK